MNYITKTVSKLQWLSSLALEKGQQQAHTIHELAGQVQEKQQEVHTYTQKMMVLEDENRASLQQVDQLKAELAESEGKRHQNKRLFEEAQGTISELRQVNGSLQAEMDTQAKNEQIQDRNTKDEGNELKLEIGRLRDELLRAQEERKVSEARLNKKLEEKRNAIKEWEKNSKKVYKDIKHNEVMQQKERYELLTKIKELKNKVSTQRKDIKEQQTQIAVMKHKEAVALSKEALASHGYKTSFTNQVASVSFVTQSQQQDSTQTTENKSAASVVNADVQGTHSSQDPRSDPKEVEVLETGP